MSDPFVALLRTYWPLLLGTVATIAGAWLTEHLGVTVNSTMLGAAVGAVAVGVVYALGRWLETRSSPLAQAAGRWLISAGKDLGQPTYTAEPTSPAAHRME